MTQPTNTKKGPFRFTRWFPTPEPLGKWLGWFAERGIPAGIVSRSEYPNFALWRTGIDAVEYGKRPRFTIDMRCDRSVNGFIDQFDKLMEEARNARARLVVSQERKTQDPVYGRGEGLGEVHRIH